MNEKTRGIVPQNDRNEPQMRHMDWVVLPHFIDEECSTDHIEDIEYVEVSEKESGALDFSIAGVLVYRLAFVALVAGGVLVVVWLVELLVRIVLESLLVLGVLYVAAALFYVFANVRRGDGKPKDDGDIVIENNVSGDGRRNVTIINNVKF